MNPAAKDKITGFKLLTETELHSCPSIMYVIPQSPSYRNHLLLFPLYIIHREGNMTIDDMDQIIKENVIFIQQLSMALSLLSNTIPCLYSVLFSILLFVLKVTMFVQIDNK